MTQIKVAMNATTITERCCKKSHTPHVYNYM